STVLRMYAEYLERYMLFQSTGAGQREIRDIWNDINTSQGQNPDPRPVSVLNSHDNMMWWLEKSFSRLKFKKFQTRLPAQALSQIVRSIDRGFPLMASVSHQRVPGHIILIVGYTGYRPDASFANDTMSFATAVRLVVHDPYGAFDPSLNSNLWGEGRR